MLLELYIGAQMFALFCADTHSGLYALFCVLQGVIIVPESTNS